MVRHQGDPANPTYNVTVSDEIPSGAGNKAMKDADATRLHPVSSNPRSELGREKSGVGEERIAPIAESMATDVLNVI